MDRNSSHHSKQTVGNLSRKGFCRQESLTKEQVAGKQLSESGGQGHFRQYKQRAEGPEGGEQSRRSQAVYWQLWVKEAETRDKHETDDWSLWYPFQPHKSL